MKRFIISIAAVFTIFTPNTVLADQEFRELNDIAFYNPSASETCVISSYQSSQSDLSKIVDYANKEIFTSSDLGLIEQYKPFYMAAAEKEGLPWGMLAVVHYRESKLSRKNPSNGQGIYQDFERSGPNVMGKPDLYSPGQQVSDEYFQLQTDYAAKILASKAGNKREGLRNSDDDAVKYTFFGYNGRAGVYITQAIKLGFNQEQAEIGEGSPYVMNKADAIRDPNVNKSGWGQVKRDRGPIEYPANQDHGAFVMYAALRGGITSDCLDQNQIGGSISQGGLTEEQARQFVMNYGDNKQDSSRLAMNGDSYWHTGCAGGRGSNCVSFSRFFINKFSDSKSPSPAGDGKDTVKYLAATGVSTGSEPKVFSVFSTPATSNNGYGHTGVVLGIHGDTYIVGHASCGTPSGGRGNGSRGSGSAFIMIGNKNDKRIWWGGNVPTEFAYPENVDSNKILDYLKTGV